MERMERMEREARVQGAARATRAVGRKRVEVNARHLGGSAGGATRAGGREAR
jgi:hypothetical protein